LWSCCVASLSRVVVLGACVLGLSFVGIGGGNGWWAVIAPFVRKSLDYRG
jgi:predicted small integral membrane protein